MTRHELRHVILLTLNEQGEIISLFRFLIDHDFLSYYNGLATVRFMEAEGLVKIDQLLDRPGKPLHITKGKQWTTLSFISADCSASSRPPVPSR